MRLKCILIIYLLIPMLNWAQDYKIIYDDFPICSGTGVTNNFIETGQLTGNVVGISSDGTYQLHSGLVFIYDYLITDIEENNQFSHMGISLYDNHPNPINSSTSISFYITERCNVEMTIYNIKGEMVKILINDTFDKGDHSIYWKSDDFSGQRVGSGLYLYKLDINGVTKEIKKCIVMR